MLFLSVLKVQILTKIFTHYCHHAHAYTKRVLEIVKERNPNEPLFHQAVEEVLHSLDPVVEKMPEVEALNILERICEPERQAIFVYAGRMIVGICKLIVAFRVGFNSVLGPYKGGLRFHLLLAWVRLNFLPLSRFLKIA